MSQSQDEARAARIQKYKEERRKQLTARTAILFSSNVTERRPKKAAGRSQSDDVAEHLKSSSELNLNTATTSVPIRTTRTSRLRAAAATHSDSSPSPKNSNRSSSVQSLLEDAKKTPKNSKVIDRDKQRLATNKRQSNEKENVKSPPTAHNSDKEIGAIKTKSKHSSRKNILEKDKNNFLFSPKDKNVDEKLGSREEKGKINAVAANKIDSLKIEEKVEKVVCVKDEEIFNDILADKVLSDSLDKKNIEDLFNDLVVDNAIVQNHIEIELSDVDETARLKDSHKDNIPADGAIEVNKVVNVVKLEDSGVPKVVNDDVGGLLGAVCVRKVERFSELLSNLCSPCEADILFEDILVENGINGDGDLRTAPECTPPCRRAQPSPRTTSTPNHTQAVVANVATGTVAKTRNRRSLETPQSKTENSLPSSRVSPKSAFNLSFGIKSPLHKPSNTSTNNRPTERRRSSDTGTKPSCIPLKKSIEKHTRTSTSPLKQDLKSKLESPRGNTTRRSPDKAKSDTENSRTDRRYRAQKDSESVSEKYHYSKKRLTSLENNSPRETNDASHISSKNLQKNNTESNKSDAIVGGLEDKKDPKMLSTLHETVRPHASNSRLSQEMDSLAALTKQTLDRVNKLSNNLTSNKLTLDTSEQRFDSLFGANNEQKNINSNHNYNYGLVNERPAQTRGVTERLKDIDTAAQRLIDFEKQSAMFSDLNNDTSSQNRRLDISSTSCSHTPVSILKRKSINEDSALSNVSNHAIASPPVTFSPSVVEPRSCRLENGQRQGILKKRRSLDESQVARRRSCSPEVSFAEDGSIDTNKPILKNRRSSLEDVVRNRSPDGQIQGILKRKMSREEDLANEDISHGSPEPHGILKRKSNSSSSSSTASSHVSIAQAVLLAAAGGAEIVEDDKETVRPILKKKSFSEERPCLDVLPPDAPKPILKKKSMEHDDYEFDLPKKPILKSSKKLSGDEGHTSSFDMSEDDRSSRRPSLLRSRTSDHSGSECEATVKPILKQRGSSLTRERSQSPRPRLSFCADSDANISVTNISCDANDLPAAGPRRILNLAPDTENNYPCAVLRRRNLRPKSNPRSKSLVCDVNDELLSILNNRRIKVDETCENGHCAPWELGHRDEASGDDKPKTFPSIAARIKSMEQALTKDVPVNDQPSTSRSKPRDKERFKTQPVTLEEMRSVTSSLEPGQASFQAFATAGCSFTKQPVESGAAAVRVLGATEPERDPFVNFAQNLDSPPFGTSSFSVKSPITNGDGTPAVKDDSYGEATFLDFENIVTDTARKQSTLDEIEQEVNKVRVALDEDSRALEEDERQQAEADNWSLNVSCDSGVYNRASSRDSGPHSGEELGLSESQEIRENHATNSIGNEWSSSPIERGFKAMERERKSTETESVRSPQEQGSDDEVPDNSVGFALGLVKSNSVVARASMWQQLQQQAKGTPKPLIRHSRSKNKEGPSVADRFKTQPISFSSPQDTTQDSPKEDLPLAQSKSTANVLDRDEDAKLDEDDPAKMSLSEKMKMFNQKLTHKPPVAGLPRPKEDRARTSRLRTMPVLASQVQEAMEQNERLTKSLTHEEVPRNPDFQLKMELFRSASAKNTSLEYLMRQNAKFRSLDLDDDTPTERAQRMITPEVRGILKSGTTVVPTKPKTLAKGESSEGLKDEGIDSSSDDESASASSVSSSEKSCSSSDSSEETPGPKPRRFQRKNNKLKSSRTDSDLTRLQDQYPRKIQLPGANEFKERLTQAKNPEIKPILAKLVRKPVEEVKKEEDSNRYRRFVKKLDEPIQLGKLRRPPEKIVSEPVMMTQEKPPTVLKISALNQEAKNKFFGLDLPKKEKSLDELAAAVRKYIPPVSKSMSIHTMEVPGSGSDGESSGGREVRQINTRVRHRFTELAGNKRVVAQLKGQWRRMKVSAKKNIAHYKRAIKSTGGGEKPPSPSPEDQEVMAICPVDFIEDQNDFDSDAIHSIINIPTPSSSNIKNINIIDSAEIQVISDSKISYENTPSMSSIKKNINLLDSAEVLVLPDSKISYENTAPMITDLTSTEKNDNEMFKCKKKINFDDILLNNSIELVDENSGNGFLNEQKKQQPIKDTIILQENTSTLNKRKKKQENGKMLEKAGGGVQRSATHAEMPHRGGTIAERLAALQAAGANDWRARLCRLSPDREDSKAIERAKNRINESLNASVDEKKKVQIEENELGQNILADRRNKLETAAQGWRKRVPQNDASLFTVAGRLERDKVATTPPLTPPPVTTPPISVASPGVPAPNTFRSRKQPSSPTNGFSSGPLRSASCAVVSAAAVEKPKEQTRPDRESFKRSHSVSESISARLEEKDEVSPGAEKTGCPVRVPRADDETFHAFFAPLQQQEKSNNDFGGDLDLDAIDSGSRQLLTSEWARRAKRERRHAASRNPLRALAARTDLKEEYVAPPSTIREQLFKEKVTANCGLAAEALAALATKEDFSSVALRSAASASAPAGAKPAMLMHVKGRRRVQTRLVEPVHTNVNRGDCFVLTTQDSVFLYIGLYANVIERNRSTDIALHIHNTKDLGCKSTGLVKIDEQTKNYSSKHWNQFWTLLGVTENVEEYKPFETGHVDEDEIYESCIVQTNMCYEVMDDELVPIKEYWGQMPKIAMLHQSKIIVFDFGSEMYIWYGKNVPLESRRRAAQLAQELFDEGYNYEECHINPLNAAMYQGAREDSNSIAKTSKTRPEWAILSKVTQHMETILFKEKFLDWPDYSRVIKVKAPENKTNTVELTPCDAEEMWSNEYQDPDLILEGSHIGRGTNYFDKENMRHYDIKTKSVCKWVIQEYDFQKVENDAEVGEFFSGDSYIIRWEYQITVTGRELNGKPSKHNVTGRDRCAYFCWQGKDASSNEKGAAALLTVELDREKGPQVRVAQGNEPPAFLNLFQGNLIIHQGKRDTDKSRYRLFVTRGNLSNEAYLLQVPCSVRQLRSRGSLLLVDTEKGCLYIWHGARSLKHTKNIAIELANKLIARKSGYLFGGNASDLKITEVKEGEEPKEVLEALGVANKQHYNSVLGGGKDIGGDVTPRLFHFTDLGGQFEANEVLSPLRHEHLVTPFPFEQKELYSASQPALFLLDDGAAVWLWQGWWPRGEDGELEPAERNAGVGAFALRWQGLRAAALRTGDAYGRVARAQAGARPDVRVVAAGLEPRAFTDLFDTWRDHDDAADANIAHGYKAGEVLSGACELSRLTACDAVLPLAALQRRPLPEHVDPHHLERHLAPHDFQEAFGMTKEEFTALPAWKQTSLKKDVGLF